MSDLAEIGARCATLDERIFASARNRPRRTATNPQTDDLLSRWCDIAALGDRTQFRQMLERRGTNGRTIRDAIESPSVQYADGNVPPWLAHFEQFRNHVVGSSAWPGLGPVDQPRFHELFAPTVNSLWRVIVEPYRSLNLLSETAADDLGRAATAQLVRICSPTLDLELTEFGGPDSYPRFVRAASHGLLDSILRRKPMLARVIGTVLSNWRSTSEELLSRLSVDREQLRGFIGKADGNMVVERLHLDLSDRHRGGRSVCVVTFQNGYRVVYKPRALHTEIAWATCLERLDALGAPASAVSPRFLDRENYGWTSWVTGTDCTSESNVVQFYERAGAMLCLLYFFQVTDVHFENVLADGAHPVLVDVETAMHPWVSLGRLPGPMDPAYELAKHQLRDSVIATAYLPKWTLLGRDRVVRTGGLDSVVVGGSAAKGLPRIHQTAVPAAGYVKEFQRGFEQMYRFVSSNKRTIGGESGPLASFRGTTGRVVIRPTQLYHKLLQHAHTPAGMTCGVSWSLSFEYLCRTVDWENAPDDLAELLNDERRALTNLDVPVFGARVDSIVLTGGGSPINQVIERPSFEQVAERIANSDELGLARQLAFIQFALESRNVNQRRSPATPRTASQFQDPIASGDFLKGAEQIARYLADLAVRDGESIAWIGSVPLARTEGTHLQVLGTNLYSGLSGIALFFAALAHESSSAEWAQFALSALSRIRNMIRENVTATGRVSCFGGVGGTDGIGSIVYTLLLSARMLNRPTLIEDARQLVSGISIETPRVRDLHDFTDGSAGMILALLELWTAAGDRDTLAVASEFGSALSASCRSLYLNPAAGPTRPSTGFAHGAAGRALALMRLHAVTGDLSFLSAANQALQYERNAFSVEDQGWPDYRQPEGAPQSHRFRAEWCRGSAGIGLARISCLALGTDATIRDEVEAAVRSTQTAPPSPRDDLCCGNMGRVELLLEAGRLLGRESLVASARTEAERIYSSGQERQRFKWRTGSDRENVGFFTGLAGIGYQLLRLHNPNDVRSVLRWE